MLYLPRLFVYHADATIGSELSERLKVMERRLTFAIMTPAMAATWIFGIVLLAIEPAWLSEPWMHVKLAAVIAMSAMHGVFAKWRKAFRDDVNQKSARIFRLANEVPTLLMILIVIMVIGKPFT